MESESSTPVSPLYNLRWNNHTSNILQVFAEQLNSESLVDVTISCQGRFIKAHKMVLSACSPYFQELFKTHQVEHPVIIINGMSFLDIKLVVDFMYRGEIKVEEHDLGGLLLAAETLQVKGLSNVRNTFEKEQVQKVDDLEHLKQTPSDQPSDTDRRVLQSLRKSVIQDDGVGSIHTSSEESTAKDIDIQSQHMSPAPSRQDLDDDLPATIKVEPPDIRDIDEEEPTAGWHSPRLIIDMKESKETVTEGRQIDSSERKRPNILRQTIPSIRVASAHLESIDGDKFTPKKEQPETSTSAKCFLWPKRSPSILGKWGRTRLCKIPRPPNAFMIFANDWRRKLAIEYPAENNKEISVRLGSMWKNLDADSKEMYYSAARKADEEHKLKYPGYYYSPKEARMRKGLKRRPTTSATPAPMDALRFVKVYMTSAEKSNLQSQTASLLRGLLPKPEDRQRIEASLGQVTSIDTQVIENGAVQNPTVDAEMIENREESSFKIIRHTNSVLMENL